MNYWDLKVPAFPSPYGAYGFKLDCFILPLRSYIRRFPSPYGAYGFKHRVVRAPISGAVRSFRPLTGLMVLNTEEQALKLKGVKQVSVPLRGLWF